MGRAFRISQSACLSVGVLLAATAQAGNYTHIVTASKAEYTVTVDGCVDLARFSVTVEALEGEVRNVKVLPDGAYDVTNIRDMAQRVVKGCKTPQEKLDHVWNFVNASYGKGERSNESGSGPMEILITSPDGSCHQRSALARSLYHFAGLKARRVCLMNHDTNEVFYDGAWHVSDTMTPWMIRRKDGTIPSLRDLEKDPTIIRRAWADIKSKYGPKYVEKQINYWGGGYYSPKNIKRKFVVTNVTDAEVANRVRHSFKIHLRPGERVTRTLQKGRGGARGEVTVCGEKVFRPNLADVSRWAEKSDNVAFVNADGGMLKCKNSARATTIIWRLKSAFVVGGVFASGQFVRAAGDEIRLDYSTDKGDTWKLLGQVAGPKFSAKAEPISRHARSSYKLAGLNSGAAYEPMLRLVMKGESCGVKSLELGAVTLMNRIAVPVLKQGRNVVRYSDETKGVRRVKVTFRW